MTNVSQAASQCLRNENKSFEPYKVKIYFGQSKEIPTIVCCCLEAAVEAAAAAWAAAAEAVATLFSRICAGGEVRGR